MGTTIVEIRLIDDSRLTPGAAASAVSVDGRRVVFMTPSTSPPDLFWAVRNAATDTFPNDQ
jgi:hypothetical protein